MAVNPSLKQSIDKLGEGVIIPQEHVTEIRVRYNETDAQGRVHHANYPNYFELARCEMLRSAGIDYGELEKAGIHLVVVRLEVNYHLGAVFDDLLQVKTVVAKAKGVRIQHNYEIYLNETLIVDGSTTVASIDHQGAVVRLPSWLTKISPNRG